MTELMRVQCVCPPADYSFHETELEALTQEQLKVLWDYIVISGQPLYMALKQLKEDHNN